MFNLVSLNIPVRNIQNTPSQKVYGNLFVQKPDTFERSNTNNNTTCPINFTGKSNRLKEYKKVADSLELTANNAQKALDGQLATDGWAGKTADAVSVLWNSKNRATIVQNDIDTYKAQVKDLNTSIKEDKFTEKFKDMFGIDYNHANIARYNKKAQQYEAAAVADCTAKYISGNLNEHIERYNKLSGNLSDITEYKTAPMITAMMPCYTVSTSKETIFSEMENSLVKVLGDKKVLDSVLNAGGLDAKKATEEEKYKAYGFVAKFLVETSKETSKQTSKGQKLADIKADYQKSYEKAYGNKNDIQKRVDEYNRSQEIGAAFVRGVTRSALAIATTLMNPPAGFGKVIFNSAMTFGIKVAVDGSDKLTNKIDNSQDFNSEAIKKLVKSASISAAEKLATGGLGMFVPKADTGYKAVDFLLNQGRTIVIDTSMGMMSERLKKGKWATNQIIPRMIISAVFKNLKPENEIAQDLLSMTKGGINQAMKSSTRDYNPVKSFIEGTRVVLEENYKHDNKTFADLKKLADEHPEKYEKLMANLLQQEIDERAEEQNKANKK